MRSKLESLQFTKMKENDFCYFLRKTLTTSNDVMGIKIPRAE